RELFLEGYTPDEVKEQFKTWVAERHYRVVDVPNVDAVWEQLVKEGFTPLARPAKPEAKPNGKAKAEKPAKASKPKGSQATALADIAMGDNVELFRTPEGDAYADIHIDGHRETWKVNSKGFRYWLRGAHFKMTGTAVGNDATAAALDIIEAEAQFGGT